MIVVMEIASDRLIEVVKKNETELRKVDSFSRQYFFSVRAARSPIAFACRRASHFAFQS